MKGTCFQQFVKKNTLYIFAFYYLIVHQQTTGTMYAQPLAWIFFQLGTKWYILPDQFERICRWQNKGNLHIVFWFGEDWKHYGKMRKWRLLAFSPFTTTFPKVSNFGVVKSLDCDLIISVYLSSLLVAHLSDAPRRRLVVTGDSARIQYETTENSAWFFNVLGV